MCNTMMQGESPSSDWTAILSMQEDQQLDYQSPRKLPRNDKTKDWKKKASLLLFLKMCRGALRSVTTVAAFHWVAIIQVAPSVEKAFKNPSR